MSSAQKNIIIIGNGIAGTTAARYIRKLSHHHVTIISDESPYFFARTAMMYAYMGHLKWEDIQPYPHTFWAKNRIQLIHDRVTSIQPDQKHIITRSGEKLKYDTLILATGSTSNSLDIPGVHLEGVTGLYSLQDLMRIEAESARIRHAVIAGGGLIGMELAEMFHSRNIRVSFLVRESSFSDAFLPAEESHMVNDEIKDHGIELHLETELQSIHDDGSGRVQYVTTHSGEKISCDFAGITTGVHPNVAWLSASPLHIQKGILVDDYLQTNIENVFAIGDCAELLNPLPGRKKIEPIWYTGRIMGETVAHTICKQPLRYNPGLWFNSAKFFDMEYQVYGDIQPHLPTHQRTLFWRHPSLQKSIRINYTRDAVVGFNLMGIRFRQEVCEKWIREHTPIEKVLERIELAFFDAEFSTPYGGNIRDVYRKETGISLTSPKKNTYDHVHAFLYSMKTPRA